MLDISLLKRKYFCKIQTFIIIIIISAKEELSQTCELFIFSYCMPQEHLSELVHINFFLTNSLLFVIYFKTALLNTHSNMHQSKNSTEKQGQEYITKQCYII